MSHNHSTYDSNASRRDFLQRFFGIAVGAAVVPMFSGCNGDSKKTNGVPPLQTLKFYGTGTLNIEDWSKAAEGIAAKVQFTDNGNDVGPVIAQMVAGTAAEDYDLGGLQGGAESELAQAGLILPWDLSKIPNYQDVWEWAKNIPHLTHEGKQYGLPVVINADSIIYLPEKTGGKIDSYEAVFDPKFKGKASMEDAWINSVIFTAIYLKQNSLVKIDDPGNLSEQELGSVMEFLIKKKREGQFLRFWSGWEDGLSMVLSGQVSVMTGWEPIVYAAVENGVKAEYAIPREGYEGWSNDLVLHKGAKSRNLVDLAHKFANWELAGYYSSVLATKRGYVVPSKRTTDYANANHQDKVASIVSHVQQKFSQQRGNIFWQNVRPKNHKLYEEWWSKLRST